MTKKQRSRIGHIRLLTHPDKHGVKPLPIHWGAATPEARGPLIGTLTQPEQRANTEQLVRHRGVKTADGIGRLVAAKLQATQHQVE